MQNPESSSLSPKQVVRSSKAQVSSADTDTRKEKGLTVGRAIEAIVLSPHHPRATLNPWDVQSYRELL